MKNLSIAGRKFQIAVPNAAFISLIVLKCHIPNRLRFVLPISSHVTILLVSFSIIRLFAFMAQLCMARNMLLKSKGVLSRD